MSKGLFNPEQFANPGGEPWMRSDTDNMLNLYFDGATPARLAQTFKRPEKSITVRINKFNCDIDQKASTYEPFRRHSRRGKRITENERHLIEAHQTKGLDPLITAKVLQREVKEFHEVKGKDDRSEARIASQSPAAAGFMVDIILAHQYLFYCAKAPVISKADFETIRAEEKELGKGSKVFNRPPSERVLDYPPHVRALAYYLQVKKMESIGVWNFRVIPYGFVSELAESGFKLAEAWMAEIGTK